MLTSGSLDVLGRDLKFTRRVLTKNFGFTATAILTLALGIAASTVIYSVVDAVLLQPLHYQDSGDIYRVYTVDPAGLPRGTTGPPHIDPIAEEGESIESAFYGYSFEQSVVNGEGTAFAINEFRHSLELFKVFKEPMHLGRSFEAGDNYQDTVLSYQTWRDVFGSDPDILGRPINVGSGALNVIGVAAEGFEFPVGTGMWTLIYTARDAGQNRPFPLFNMPGYVRAVPGVSAAQVQAELDVFAARLGPWPGPDQRPLEFVAQPLLHEVVGDLRGTLFIVSGATGVLLLIACINVANLLLARGVVRTSEFALREAIGARRWRVFRQLMTESFVLCSLGGILGLGLALGAIQLLKAIGPADLPRLSSVAIDANVYLFAAGCVVLVAVLVGFAPALRVARGDLSALINSGGRSAATARGRNRVFGGLVVAEIALAVVLVIGAGLLVRSYSQLASADPGFDPQRMLTLVLNVTGRTDIRNMRPDQERRRIVYDGSGLLGVAQFYEELIRRIDALPGVAAAGMTSAAPLNQGLFPVVLGVFPIVGSSIPVTDHLAYVSQVSPDYFATLDIRPLAGRLLEPTDRRGGAGAVVINEAYARAYLDGENPIGRRITLPGAARPGGLAFGQLGEQTVDDAEIVGVIPDIKQATLEDAVQPALFVPQQQWHVRKAAVVIRAENDDPATLIPAIRRELTDMDSTLPGVFAVYSDVVAAGLARHRLGALVLVVFGFVSLTLAAVGTYGLMSFSVNQRVGEIAVRSAFGAERGNLLTMFVTRALQLAAIGVVLGIAGAVAMRQVVASQLYETSALDPWVLALVPLTMLVVALLASYVPARRASRIDVSAALREN
jgi:predicted permease